MRALNPGGGKDPSAGFHLFRKNSAFEKSPASRIQPVPFGVYSREYFLTDNSGFDHWLKTGGSTLEPRHEYAFALGRPTSRDRVLDYGCGRGEIVLQSALCGANVVGVDYARAAIDLTRETLSRAGLCEGDRLQILLLDGKRLPFPDGTFTKVFFLDVIEHLTPLEVSTVLTEFYRVMTSQGQLIMHTSPNRIYYECGYPRFTYPLSKLVDSILEKVRGRGLYNLPRDPRTPSEKLRHINEQGLGSLKSALHRTGFRYKVWASERLLKRMMKDPRFTLSRLLIKPAFWPLNYLFASDLWAIAWKRTHNSLRQIQKWEEGSGFCR